MKLDVNGKTRIETCRNQSGYVIADLVVAISVLTLGMFAVFYSLERGTQNARYCHERQVALEAVQSQIELIRATPYDELTFRERAPYIGELEELEVLPHRKPWLTVENYGTQDSGLKKVTAGLDWLSGSKRWQKVYLVTLIGRGGMHRR